jgi:hypothetical protein
MKQKIAITIDQELLVFLDRQAQGNRSDYLNALLSQERQKSLVAAMITGLQEDLNNPEYQAEIAEWDQLVADGIDA